MVLFRPLSTYCPNWVAAVAHLFNRNVVLGISGGIAEKAARAGLAWVASRSVPTTLAVEIAAAAGLPIVARAAGKDARVFAPHHPPPDMGGGRPGNLPDLGDMGDTGGMGETA